jgi:hypothetical protein
MHWMLNVKEVKVGDLFNLTVVSDVAELLCVVFNLKTHDLHGWL